MQGHGLRLLVPKPDEMQRLRQEDWKAVEIAEELGISRASVFRVLKHP